MAGLIAAVSPAAMGALVATDNFESYTAGAQLNALNGGSGFTGAYVVDPTKLAGVTVVNQSINYTGGTVASFGGNRAAQIAGGNDSNALIARGIPAQTATPVYFSFLFNNSSASEAFLQFGLENGAAGEPNASVGVQGSAGNGSGSEAFFARVPNGGSTVFGSPTTFDVAGTTYLVVGKVSKSTGAAGAYDTIDFFVNPTSQTEGTPNATVTNATATVTSFNNFVVRSARTDAGSTYTFDNLTIGTTFADVVPTPEPGALGLVGLGAVAGLARRRARA
jgi:hypothetical protein